MKVKNPKIIYSFHKYLLHTQQALSIVRGTGDTEEAMTEYLLL